MNVLTLLRLIGSHQSTAGAREACEVEGGELFSLDNAQDAQGTLGGLTNTFRLQGTTAGEDGIPGTCWTDGQGNEV